LNEARHKTANKALAKGSDRVLGGILDSSNTARRLGGNAVASLECEVTQALEGLERGLSDVLGGRDLLLLLNGRSLVSLGGKNAVQCNLREIRSEADRTAELGLSNESGRGDRGADGVGGNGVDQ
jgi:hypothetical protein